MGPALGSEKRQLWKRWEAVLGFTRGSLRRDGSQLLPACQPIEQELALPIGLQATDGDLTLVCGHRYHLGLPSPILVLDHKGVECALGGPSARGPQSAGSRLSLSVPQERRKFCVWDWKRERGTWRVTEMVIETEFPQGSGDQVTYQEGGG